MLAVHGASALSTSKRTTPQLVAIVTSYTFIASMPSVGGIAGCTPLRSATDSYRQVTRLLWGTGAAGAGVDDFVAVVVVVEETEAVGKLEGLAVSELAGVSGGVTSGVRTAW